MVNMTRRKFLGGLFASLAVVGCSLDKKELTEAQKRQESRIKLAEEQGACLACEVNDADPTQYSKVINKIFKHSDKIIQIVDDCSATLSVNAGLDKALTQFNVGDVYKKMFIRNYGDEVFSIQNAEETKRLLTWANWTEKFQAQAQMAQELSAKGYDENGLVPRPRSDIFWRYLNNGTGAWRRNVSSIKKSDITAAKHEAEDIDTQKLLKMRAKKESQL